MKEEMVMRLGEMAKDRTVEIPENLATQLIALASNIPSGQGAELWIALKPVANEIGQRQEADRKIIEAEESSKEE